MALTTSEAQSYLDNDGYVYFDKGTHTITSKVVVTGLEQQDIVCHPRAQIVYTGSSATGCFEFEQATANTNRIQFKGVNITCTNNGASCFKVQNNDDALHWLRMMDCHFISPQAYCVDFPLTPYCITPIFKRMRTEGGGAIRWRANPSGVDAYHSVSACLFDVWHHTGYDRVGPAWNFRGMTGFRGRHFTDAGVPDILPALVSNGWEGPVTFRIDSCRTRGRLEWFKLDYTSGWTNAPNCWHYDIRTQSGGGTGKQEYWQAVAWDRQDSLYDSAMTPWTIMGGPNTTSHGMIVDLDEIYRPQANDFTIGGRIWVRCNRPWYDPGEEALYAALQAKLDAVSMNSCSDPLLTNVDRAPANTTDGGQLIAGGSLEDDWYDTAPEFEEVLA